MHCLVQTMLVFVAEICRQILADLDVQFLYENFVWGILIPI